VRRRPRRAAFVVGHSAAMTENIAESRSRPSSPGACDGDQCRSRAHPGPDTDQPDRSLGFQRQHCRANGTAAVVVFRKSLRVGRVMFISIIAPDKP
jgi:hypothetical protein